jgi:hypothetical protein
MPGGLCGEVHFGSAGAATLVVLSDVSRAAGRGTAGGNGWIRSDGSEIEQLSTAQSNRLPAPAALLPEPHSSWKRREDLSEDLAIIEAGAASLNRSCGRTAKHAQMPSPVLKSRPCHHWFPLGGTETDSGGSVSGAR